MRWQRNILSALSGKSARNVTIAVPYLTNSSAKWLPLNRMITPFCLIRYQRCQTIWTMNECSLSWLLILCVIQFLVWFKFNSLRNILISVNNKYYWAMKITKRSIAFGSLSPIINRTTITLVLCLMLFDIKWTFARPRSGAKNALDFFSREARFAKVGHRLITGPPFLSTTVQQ